ncbi:MULTISPECIES: large conductance mechanosensitive channel protein MscL [Microbacterium]|uniref:large conductance mechanosensitive channel protein MscL n=1 Tax=Microbacterium TaxID=33882 RepID=UPI00217F0B43|nr:MULTISPECIES: large conductance mechanosensitive channel protein MscL [Microbacterium]UWF77025.1 large conductance mechanosensitive channel protein MscL [Microbacterium neungamense]WCM55185.1 large conductance mechanosensitive channel protein MscL [Microbacterium sp. EF45047]
MLKGFKEFIAQGNVIDLAVAVVIGAAFSAIVTAIVDNLINPIIGLLFNAEDLSNVKLGVIGIGAIIGAVINFLAVALIVYLVFVMPMNKYRERQAAKNPAVEEETLPTEQELLIEIRDELRRSAAR